MLPVAAREEELDDDKCYKGKCKCVTDIDMIFPDLQPDEYNKASVAACCNGLL